MSLVAPPVPHTPTGRDSTATGITAQRIVELYRQRKARMAPIHGRMGNLRDQIENLVRVNLPELDQNEVPGVANLASLGVDQLAMRIASTMPSVVYPPLRPGIQRSEDLARTRRLANYAWWEKNRFAMKQRKRAKWLVAYATAPVLLRPNFKMQIPMWQLAEPFCTFPAPLAEEDDICPTDGILAYRRHLSWLLEHYPQKARALELGKDPSPDTELEILDYIDAEVEVVVAVGRPTEISPGPLFGPPPRAPGLPFVELERFPNRVGRCTLVYPTRPSLNNPISQFDAMPAIYKMQARVMATWMIANERATFADPWLESHPNQEGEIIQVADGRAGIVGLVKGGELKEIATPPNPAIGNLVEMLERNMRFTAGMSAQEGGENPTNIRTGRAGEQLLSATTDFYVQEGQETLANSYTEENKLAIKIAKTFFGSTPKSFHVNWKGAKGPVDYIPLRDFETDDNTVSWPVSGSDANQVPIGIGQRVGLEEMSIQTAQELDPWIEDAEEERRRLIVQSVNKALMAAIDQQVAQGQIGPKEIADFAEKVIEGRMDLYKAYQELHDDVQQQQAQMQQGPEAGGPAPGSPEGMPGLAAPGQQAALGLPAPGPAAGVPQPGPGLQHMQQLLGMLKGGPRA